LRFKRKVPVVAIRGCNLCHQSRWRRGVGRGQDKQAAEPGATRALGQDPASAGRGQLATRRADTVPAANPAKPAAKGRKARAADDDDDDLGDVADILRRHGIT